MSNSRPARPPEADSLDPATKRRALIVSVVFVLLIGAMILISVFGIPMKGTERGAVPVPGQTVLDVKSGDILRFTTDADVVFLDPSNVRGGSLPEGCKLELSLEVDGKTIATTCDFFRQEGGYAVRSTSYTKLGNGLKHLELSGARTSCAFRAPAAGKASLRAKSNLDTCVRSVTSARASIYVETAGS